MEEFDYIILNGTKISVINMMIALNEFNKTGSDLEVLAILLNGTLRPFANYEIGYLYNKYHKKYIDIMSEQLDFRENTYVLVFGYNPIFYMKKLEYLLVKSDIKERYLIDIGDKKALVLEFK